MILNQTIFTFLNSKFFYLVMFQPLEKRETVFIFSCFLHVHGILLVTGEEFYFDISLPYHKGWLNVHVSIINTLDIFLAWIFLDKNQDNQITSKPWSAKKQSQRLDDRKCVTIKKEPKTIKLLSENRINALWYWIWQWFLDITQKAHIKKKK